VERRVASTFLKQVECPFCYFAVLTVDVFFTSFSIFLDCIMEILSM
jgi:hypothetical protein